MSFVSYLGSFWDKVFIFILFYFKKKNNSLVIISCPGSLIVAVNSTALFTSYYETYVQRS
jgi:hypothetical protein